MSGYAPAKMRISLKVSLMAVGTALFATAILTFSGYQAARHNYLAGTDRQLLATASAVPGLLGQTYVGAAAASQLTPSNYDAMVLRLSQIADNAGVYYLYAFEQVGDQIVHLATSASPAERKDQSWATFRQPYDQPPASLLRTLLDGQPRFDQYTDEFGTFRSYFVRHPLADGRYYVVGVDLSLDAIHADLRRLILHHVLTGVAVAALAGGLGVVVARRISHPLQTLSAEVQNWSTRDFQTHPVARTSIVRIARHHTDEVGQLASRFVQLQDRLDRYMRDLVAASAARQKIEHQLEIAQTIQESLLPSESPKADHFDISGWSKPADQTGGDYFDWIALPDGTLVLTIGDVTGHGIGPALVTAASRAYGRATFQAGNSLNQAITLLNNLLHIDLAGDRFVTLIACVLDPGNRCLKMVAAGHGPAMFYSRALDTLDMSFEAQGLPLGMFDSADYDRPIEFQFHPGDALVLISDGITDWSNPSGEMFGTERARDSILASCRQAPGQILERLRADIAAFHGGKPQSDDTTALVIRCTS